MTFLLCGMAFLLAVVMSGVVGRVGTAITDRARAQTAADSAALAAVAEAALGGSGDPAGAAARFARLNAGVLTGCLCEPGATAAQVRVTLGSASARARAAFDPGRVLPAEASPGALDPALDAAIDRLLALSDHRVFVVSGFRSLEEQSALWNEALRTYGSAEAADDWVARPGTSAHELGLAVDLGGDLDLAMRVVERHRLPLTRPLPNEPWHFELLRA